MFSKKLFLAFGLVVLAFVFSACTSKPATNSQVTQNQAPVTFGEEAKAEVTIVFGDSGVVLSTSTVKSGGKITWTNNTQANVEVGSDPHPQHTTNQEITGGNFVIDLAPGASSTVTITKTGTFGFHDHEKPSVEGMVAVQ